MNFPGYWGAPDWAWPAALIATASCLVLVWSYARTTAPLPTRIGMALLKAVGISLLAICLIEPMYNQARPKPGENVFVILADQSQSLTIADAGSERSRQEQMATLLRGESRWQQQLEKDYDLRRFTFDSRIHAVNDFADLEATGNHSALGQSLQMIQARFQGKPSAGILLLTDGNATDGMGPQVVDGSGPPIYPVVIGKTAQRDISLSHLTISQTHFESAPVTVTAEIATRGYQGQSVVAELVDEEGTEVARKLVTGIEDGRRFAVRFEIKPEGRGVHFYSIRVRDADGDSPFGDQANTARASDEATLINNQRRLAVDRGKGPYRVLYVCGRPNWESKFLRRALDDDDEVDLVSLVRIAKREPKFSFRGRVGETTNPLFRGFENQDDDQAEQYDEPVLLRLGTDGGEELRDGFPDTADQLFRYHAIILDDLEADFFSEDQKSLVNDFVNLRGGSLLMLGGQESFVKGNYDRTPIGELLPVYLDGVDPAPMADNYRLELTREGWLQPWVRVRATEELEQQRLQTMPPFRTVNRARSIKPGADVLARIRTSDGQSWPALVVHRFGRGRSAALLIADLWRWHTHESPGNDDLMKSWRQTVRWMVADVPQRLEVDVEPSESDPHGHGYTMRTVLRDPQYQALDNAKVVVRVTRPDGETVEMAATPDDDHAGTYLSGFVALESGFYSAEVVAFNADGSELGSRQTGWAVDSAVDEFAELTPNTQLLQDLAERSGGEIVSPQQLNRFVDSMPTNATMVMETRVRPWWHHWTLFAAALGCFIGEWGWRRWAGLP